MNKYVLLIDDDEDELEIFTDALNKIKLPVHFYCQQTKNIEQAMPLLQKTIPDFIFLDFNMPGINGLGGLYMIKREKKLSQIPVILYSSIIDDEMNEKALALGAAACIRKPHYNHALTKKLQDLFQAMDKIN